jgi:hypothetical protein
MRAGGAHSEDAVNERTHSVCSFRSRVCFTRLRVNIHGEFDPGSGRTLAACLTHASRTMNLLREGISGERVSNTWAICPSLWDKPWKRGLIPDTTTDRMVWWWKAPAVKDEPAAYQLVGGVMAYQGDDG